MTPETKQFCVLRNTWGEKKRGCTTSLTNHVAINEGTSDKYPLVFLFCGDASVWIKGLSLKKRREALNTPPCGNNSALCTLLTPRVSTCFPFLFGVSAKCVTQGECRVSGAGVREETGLPSAVYSGRHQLWIPACSQLPTCHLTSGVPPRVTLPGRGWDSRCRISWSRRRSCRPSGLLVMRTQPLKVSVYLP